MILFCDMQYIIPFPDLTVWGNDYSARAISAPCDYRDGKFRPPCGCHFEPKFIESVILANVLLAAQIAASSGI